MTSRLWHRIKSRYYRWRHIPAVRFYDDQWRLTRTTRQFPTHVTGCADGHLHYTIDRNHP